MNLLIAQHDTANPASGRVMEKAGMLFSHNMPYDKIDDKDLSRLITSATYVITKEDYFNALELTKKAETSR